MTLQQLRYVIAISETGSLNKAAEQLYVAQPSLTSSIKELEKELGITIFNRSGRGVSLTSDGVEFLSYARQVYQQYENMMEKYGKIGGLKKKFGVSTQHYSFAVKAFVEMVKSFDATKYEFALRETRTRNVIDDVSTQKSEIGILYLSDFNRKIVSKLLYNNNLEFHRLLECDSCVYLWREHPLAKRSSISFKDLEEYTCISYEQGDNSSFYFAEEVLSTYDYRKIIKADDRATLLNLMVGMNAFTLCSGIITEDLNGSDYIAVPLAGDDRMTIGYIKKARVELTDLGRNYINQLKIIGQRSGEGVVMLSEPPETSTSSRPSGNNP
jgi:DNA-binding transcriptional LysR family regulator